jgi:hypothetical protein
MPIPASRALTVAYGSVITAPMGVSGKVLSSINCRDEGFNDQPIQFRGGWVPSRQTFEQANAQVIFKGRDTAQNGRAVYAERFRGL